MTPEGRVKVKVKAWLVANKVWHYCPVSIGMGTHGIPDFVCCAPGGRFMGIEVKAPGKRKNTSALQDMQLEAIAENGGLAIVVDDVSQLEGIL